MVASRTSPNPMRDSTQLLSTGPFGFSRHPFFLGTILAFLGSAIAFNGLWLLIAPVWLAATAPLQAAREERYLEMRFGEPYVEYRRRVRRWI